MGSPEYTVHWDSVKWDEAQRRCEDEGKNLVSIHSKEERETVTALMSGDWFWVGFNDRESEGNWVWNDGTPTDYEPWHSGEPGGMGDTTKENCAFDTSSRTGFSDVPCDWSIRF